MAVTINGTTGITTPEIISSGGPLVVNASAPDNSFLMDASGRVTMPNQPGFTARLGVTSPFSTSAPIIFDSVAYNIGSHYNSATGIFTAPVAGRYLFCVFALRSSGGSSFVELRLRINGAVVTAGYGVPAYSQSLDLESLTANWIVNLNASDTLAVEVNSASTPVSLYGTETGASCILVG